MYLTFRTEVNAVHKLWNPDLTDERNLELFAECANPAGHGHLYRIEVTVKAPVSAGRPVVMNRADIRRVIDDVILPKLQDCDMNTVFEHERFISTGENVIPDVWKLVASALPEGVELAAVHMGSTPNNRFSLTAADESRRLA